MSSKVFTFNLISFNSDSKLSFFNFETIKKNKQKIEGRVLFLFPGSVTRVTHEPVSSFTAAPPLLLFSIYPHWSSNSSMSWSGCSAVNTLVLPYVISVCVVSRVGLEITNPAWLCNVPVWPVKVFELHCHGCLFSWSFLLGFCQPTRIRPPHIVTNWQTWLTVN